MQRCREKKIRVCGKESIPFQDIFFVLVNFVTFAMLLKNVKLPLKKIIPWILHWLVLLGHRLPTLLRPFHWSDSNIFKQYYNIEGSFFTIWLPLSIYRVTYNGWKFRDDSWFPATVYLFIYLLVGLKRMFKSLKKSQKIKNLCRNILFSSFPSTSRYRGGFISLLEQIPSSFLLCCRFHPGTLLLLTPDVDF